MDSDDFQEKFAQIVEQLQEERSENEADYWAVRDFYEARSYFLRTAAVVLIIGATVVSLAFALALLLIAAKI